MPRTNEVNPGMLKRGSACLSCRRRKLKCDGVRPVCQPCANMKRDYECKYDDNTKKSRTQLLREKLMTLQATVRALEDNNTFNHDGPSRHDKMLHVDNDLSREGRARRRRGEQDPHESDESPFAAFLQITSKRGHSPFPRDEYSPSDTDSSDESMLDEADFPEQRRFLLPPELQVMYLESLLRHRSQCSYYIDVSRCNPFSTAYHHDPPPAALLSSIMLMGCFFTDKKMTSRDGVPDEDQLLEQAILDIPSSLVNEDNLLAIVQALTLLAQYYYFNAEPLEGHRYLLAARRHLLDLGLTDLPPRPDMSLFPPFGLENGFDGWGLQEKEWDDRCTVFWQTYSVYNCWSGFNSVVIGGAGQSGVEFSMRLDTSRAILTPLPTIPDPEGAFDTMDNSLVHTILDPEPFIGTNLTVLSLKAIASGIFNSAVRLHDVTQTDTALWSTIVSLQRGVQRLVTIVPPFIPNSEERGHRQSSFDSDLFTANTYLCASTIFLHRDSALNVKLSWATSLLLDLVDHVTEATIKYVDPCLMWAWFVVIKVFRKLVVKSTKGGESSSFPTESLAKGIDALTLALRSMSTWLPLGEQLLMALSEMRDSPGSPESDDEEPTTTVISGQTTYSARVGVMGTV